MAPLHRLVPVVAVLAASFACDSFQPVDSVVPSQNPDSRPTGNADSDLDTGDTGLDNTDPNNTPPVANAGPDQTGITPGTMVQLDGRASDLDDDPLTLLWTIKSRPANSVNAFVQNETFEDAELFVDVPGDFIMEFSVNDGKATARDTMRVTVINDNLPPVADAGFDQSNVCIGEQVQLDGSASYDPDGDPITWHWDMRRRPAGSTAQLFGVSLPSAADRPYFIPDRAGLYSIELRVEDDKGLRSPADTVSITTRDCSQQSTSSSGSSSSGGCLDCAEDVATASAGRLRTGGLAASWALFTLPFLVLLYHRRDED